MSASQSCRRGGRYLWAVLFLFSFFMGVPGAQSALFSYRPVADPRSAQAILSGIIVPHVAKAPPANAAPILAATVYRLPDRAWQVPVRRDGLYALSYDTLLHAGVPVTGTAPASYHLSWMDKAVAMIGQGTSDGAFDPGDAFLFYGRKFHGSEQDEKYGDENVYWLTLDDTSAGLRCATRSVMPDALAEAATAYTATARAEEDNVYWARWSDHPGTTATWFWERAIAVTRPLTRTYPLTVTGVVTSAGQAVLRTEVAARSYNRTRAPDHHLRWFLNGSPVGEDWWDGKVGEIFTVTLPAGLLREGVNALQMELVPDVGVQDIYFDRATLTYPRVFRAQDDRLLFAAPVGGRLYYTLTGFSRPPPYLFDLTDPLRPIRLVGATASSTLPGAITFTDQAGAGALYGAFVRPWRAAAQLYRPPPDLLRPLTGADEIMITPAAFYTATLRLADWRRASGLRVRVVRVEDIYALFNGGVFHPRAIRAFLAYSYAHWPGSPPTYVLLVGDGNFNFRGHNPAVYGAPGRNLIPPYLAFADPYQGEVAVDSRYAAVVGDDLLPDMAVGRLPVDSVAELQAVIDKLIAYDRAAPAIWSRRAIFVSDNSPDRDGDFDAVLAGLQGMTPPGMLRRHLSLTTYCGAPGSMPASCAMTATRVLTQTWSAGAALLTYAGHGAVYRWAQEPLLTNRQLGTLQPGTGWPFVLSLDCLDGYFMMPPGYPGYTDTRSMAEIALTLPDRGAIAYFAPAGLGSIDDEQMMARALYDALFRRGVRRLGDLTQVARRASSTHLAQTYTLFGDPATVIVLRPQATYLPLLSR